MVGLWDADGQPRICGFANVKELLSMRFGHIGIVIIDEEDLPICSRVCEIVVSEAFPAAQFNNNVFGGDLG